VASSLRFTTENLACFAREASDMSGELPDGAAESQVLQRSGIKNVVLFDPSAPRLINGVFEQLEIAGRMRIASEMTSLTPACLAAMQALSLRSIRSG
jgi:hypothetical protein